MLNIFDRRAHRKSIVLSFPQLHVTMADRVQEGKKTVAGAAITKMENEVEQQENEESSPKGESEKKSRPRKYLTKHMKQFPELYRSDVSIHPSYTALKNFP